MHTVMGAPDLDQLNRRLTTPLAQLTGAVADVREMVGDVLARWQEPHRRYHAPWHLHGTLVAHDQLVAELDVTGRPVTATLTELALWYHDVIYDPAAADNEAASAHLLHQHGRALHLDPGDLEYAGALIDATATHTLETANPGDEQHLRDLSVVLDADLATLALPAHLYDQATDLVRAEYAHVTDEQWAHGRSTIIRTFLTRPRLFHSSTTFADHWDERARENLRRELHRYQP